MAQVHQPKISSSFDKLVVPTIGAVTPGFESTLAIAIWGMLTPFHFHAMDRNG